MKYKLIVKPEAIDDMSSGFYWYENKRAGLGSEFLDEVDEFYSRITQNPEHYQSHKNQRAAVLHRFPYKIIYEIEGESKVVYAVYHDKQDPEKLIEMK
jgi:mRNA-degrading endonuclease RelE of RelBE toxin-antitoxin system